MKELNGKEFRKFATKHLNLNGNTVDNVIKHQVEDSMTPYILEERQMNVTQMDVFSRLMKDRIVWVSGAVNQYMSDVVQAQLLFLDSLGTNDITMQISSPGGSVLSGLSIVDVMNYIKSDVATINLGMSCSMGSILLSSGKKGKRSSLIFSRVMIHHVSSGTQGVIEDQQITLTESHKYNYLLFQILAENCGKTFDEVYEISQRDKWLNSKESLDFGIIDEIIGLDKNKSIDQYMVGFDKYYEKHVLSKM